MLHQRALPESSWHARDQAGIDLGAHGELGLALLLRLRDAVEREFELRRQRAGSEAVRSYLLAAGGTDYAEEVSVRRELIADKIIPPWPSPRTTGGSLPL